MKKINKYFTILIISLFSTAAKSETITMPSSLTADTTDFVLLSSSGTTPSISGFSGTLLVTATASSGTFVKVTSITNLKQAKDYCGHTGNADAEPTGCDDDNREIIGLRGTQADLNAALATLSFKGDGATGSPTVVLSVTPDGTNRDPDTGHYYQVVTSSNNITWAAARTAAKSDAKILYGLRGYLTNITTSGENAFITAKIGANAWIGATDVGTEKIWKWIDGPEDGNIFTCQTDSGGHGATFSGCAEPSGVYKNWASGEPNQYQSRNEDCAHLKSNGEWNDFRCGTEDSVKIYVIEYGGQAGETATVSGLTTLTISSLEASGSTHQAFNDKQLSGIVEAQTESMKRHMYNSTNSIMDRMEQFRRTGDNKGLQLNDFRLALADLGVNDHTHAKLALSLIHI